MSERPICRPNKSKTLLGLHDQVLVAELRPTCAGTTRGLSCDHEDAIDATTSSVSVHFRDAWTLVRPRRRRRGDVGSRRRHRLHQIKLKFNHDAESVPASVTSFK